MEHVMLESWRGFLEKEDSKEEDKYIYTYMDQDTNKNKVDKEKKS